MSSTSKAGSFGPVRRRSYSDHATSQSEFGTPGEFCNTFSYIAKVQHSNTLEPVPKRLAEISQPIIVRPADSRLAGDP